MWSQEYEKDVKRCEECGNQWSAHAPLGRRRRILLACDEAENSFSKRKNFTPDARFNDFTGRSRQRIIKEGAQAVQRLVQLTHFVAFTIVGIEENSDV
jgi:hypothetical protein